MAVALTLLCFFCLIVLFDATDHEWKYVCHTNGGPMDSSLHCNSSPHQIVFSLNQQRQKKNLIIMDIDHTILEAVEGFHNAIPLSFRNNAERCPFSQLYDESLDLHLLLIVCVFESHTSKYSIVFRKHFFDILKYFHLNQEFSADLVLYTRARPDYARQIALGIIECYKAKWPNHNLNDTMQPLFKMVISSLTPNTAKTIGTLTHNLNLSKYQNIVILDDDGRKCWCKFEMMKLRLQSNINFMLIQVPVFSIWKEVHSLFRELLQSGCYSLSSQPKKSKTFYALIRTKQNEDSLFFHFCALLQSLQKNETNVINRFAVPLRDMDHFNRLSPLTWWEWFQFQSTRNLAQRLQEQ